MLEPQRRPDLPLRHDDSDVVHNRTLHRVRNQE
jgi:hypothetical protein